MPRPPISDEVLAKVARAYEKLSRQMGTRRPTAVQVYRAIGGDEQSEISDRKVAQLVSEFKKREEGRKHHSWNLWEGEGATAEDSAFLARLNGTCRIWFGRPLFQHEAVRASRLSVLLGNLNCLAQLFIVLLYGNRDRIAYLMGLDRSIATTDLDDWVTFWPGILQVCIDENLDDPHWQAELRYRKLVEGGIGSPPPSLDEVNQSWAMEFDIEDEYEQQKLNDRFEPLMDEFDYYTDSPLAAIASWDESFGQAVLVRQILVRAAGALRKTRVTESNNKDSDSEEVVEVE
jgi:hypothetical protein